MSGASSEQKFPTLDGLRAVSILLVLGCHLLPLGPKVLRLNEAAGAMGMSLFFALSGFLITSGLIKNPSVTEFLARRITRILPLAYGYTIVVFLVLTFNPKVLLWTNLFATNYLTEYVDPGWTGHFWSLCVEIHFYVAFAIVVLIFGQRGIWVVWPACFCVTLMRINAGEYYPIITHLRADEILTGACAATLFHYVRLSPRIDKDKVIRLLPVALGLSVFLWAISSHPFSFQTQYIRPYAAASLLLFSLNYGLFNQQSLLESRPLRYIARISYALYVIHPATAHGWMSEGGTMTKYLLKRPISFALSFAIAHFSTFYWERPWQTATKRWIQWRRQKTLAGIAVPNGLHSRDIA